MATLKSPIQMSPNRGRRSSRAFVSSRSCSSDSGRSFNADSEKPISSHSVPTAPTPPVSSNGPSTVLYGIDTNIDAECMDQDECRDSDTKRFKYPFAEDITARMALNYPQFSYEQRPLGQACTYPSPFIFQTFHRIDPKPSSKESSNDASSHEEEEEEEEEEIWRPVTGRWDTTHALFNGLIMEAEDLEFFRSKLSINAEEALLKHIQAMNCIEEEERRREMCRYYWVVCYLQLYEGKFSVGLKRFVAGYSTVDTGYGYAWKT